MTDATEKQDPDPKPRRSKERIHCSKAALKTVNGVDKPTKKRIQMGIEGSTGTDHETEQSMRQAGERFPAFCFYKERTPSP